MVKIFTKDPEETTSEKSKRSNKSSRKLGEILVDEGHLSKADLKIALVDQKDKDKPIGQLLVDLGLVSERQLARGLAERMEVPFIDLSQETPDEEAVESLNESLAREHQAVPLRLDGKNLIVAFGNPSEANFDALKKSSDVTISPAIAAQKEVAAAIENAYRAISALEQHVTTFNASVAIEEVAETITDKSTADDAPVVQVVSLIATQALRDRASDIHVEPQEDKIRIRFRIDGALHDVATLPPQMGSALVSRLKVLANMNIVEKRRPQDGQIAMNIDGQSVDIRVSTTATVWGEKAVLRILDKRRSLYSLDNLGMSEKTHEVVSRLVRQPFGMVICAGPTGSGKTTTLYASLEEINRPERNIMTIEDPVEYIVGNINQIQINEQAGITFAGGLKSILRQDPDVILVGEIRDVETARIAVQSALTGHLVLSSLHATDSVSALHRFLDMGLESFLIASSVNAVVGQRLLRRICQSCKAEYTPTNEEIKFYEESGGWVKPTYYRGEGCNFCAQTGYQDRIGVYEVLVISDEIRDAVVANAPADEIRELAIKQGMRTLRDEAIRLVNENVTTIDEVLRTIYSF